LYVYVREKEEQTETAHMREIIKGKFSSKQIQTFCALISVGSTHCLLI
jgi:hypothetical protein